MSTVTTITMRSGKEHVVVSSVEQVAAGVMNNLAQGQPFAVVPQLVGSVGLNIGMIESFEAR